MVCVDAAAARIDAAVLSGDAPGSLVVSGVRPADAARVGEGAGDVWRTGDGNGSASRSSLHAIGDARREGAGFGHAVRVGTGRGDADRLGPGAGNALRTENGRGVARRDSQGSGVELGRSAAGRSRRRSRQVLAAGVVAAVLCAAVVSRSLSTSQLHGDPGPDPAPLRASDSALPPQRGPPAVFPVTDGDRVPGAFDERAAGAGATRRLDRREAGQWLRDALDRQGLTDADKLEYLLGTLLRTDGPRWRDRVLEQDPDADGTVERYADLLGDRHDWPREIAFHDFSPGADRIRGVYDSDTETVHVADLPASERLMVFAHEMQHHLDSRSGRVTVEGRSEAARLVVDHLSLRRGALDLAELAEPVRRDAMHAILDEQINPYRFFPHLTDEQRTARLVDVMTSGDYLHEGDFDPHDFGSEDRLAFHRWKHRADPEERARVFARIHHGVDDADGADRVSVHLDRDAGSHITVTEGGSYDRTPPWLPIARSRAVLPPARSAPARSVSADEADASSASDSSGVRSLPGIVRADPSVDRGRLAAGDPRAAVRALMARTGERELTLDGGVGLPAERPVRSGPSVAGRFRDRDCDSGFGPVR